MRFSHVAVLAGSLTAWTSHSENLLQGGGFEAPEVSGRTPEGEGGSPLKAADQKTWAAFAISPEVGQGKVIAGITNEIARTGKQSLFVDFQNVTAGSRGAVLRTMLFPAKTGATYRVSIWGRIDRNRPVALDERRPRMLVQVDYYGADGISEGGERTEGERAIPGEVIPGRTPELTFVSGKWKESFAIVTPPTTAVFMRITWTWATPNEPGATDGVVFWDDASVIEAGSQK